MMEKKKFLGVSRVAIFVIEVVSFWIIFFLNGYFWLYGEGDIYRAVIMLLAFAVVIIIINFFWTLIKLKNDFLIAKDISVIRKMALVFVVLIFFVTHIIMCFSFYDKMGSHTSGSFTIANKQEMGNSYYLYVNRNNHLVEIECTKDIYNNLIVDEKVQYVFSYNILIYNDDKGVLEGSIDTKDYIDNREKNIK